jgi:hypothetical protein
MCHWTADQDLTICHWTSEQEPDNMTLESEQLDPDNMSLER